MSVHKNRREIAKKLLLKGKTSNVPAADFFALVQAFIKAASSEKIGFNHASTDILGWLDGFAPFGVNMDEAFLEDMLYAANMLNELGKFKHPFGKTFNHMLRSVLNPNQKFDLITNTIVEKR